MADTTSATSVPALPSTADPTPYVPVSWMAVAAMLVSGLFVLVLVVLGIAAFVSKKPLIEIWLVIFPLVAMVLSFVARRQIRNSEGTRTGEKLANAAWWLALVAGLGYWAYWVAIDFSIRRDAKAEVQRWMDYIIKEDVNRAFVRTLEPGRRQNIRAEDTPGLVAQFRDMYLVFGQCDLVQLAQRNKGACTFVPGGLRDWAYRPQGIDCIVTGEIKCPEGTFPVNVGLKGFEGVTGVEGGTRQWMIVPSKNGYVAADKVTLTPYGWLLNVVQQSGHQFGREFLNHVASGPTLYPLAYHRFIGPAEKLSLWSELDRTTPARAAVGGVSAVLTPYYTADCARFFRDNFFRLPGGEAPSTEQKRAFAESWNAFGLFAPGTRIKSSVDTNPTLGVTDAAVEMRIPCELPMRGSDGSSSATRCRLVIATTDPGLLAELKRLRAEANPDRGTSTPPPDLGNHKFQWRVVRVETDLYVVGGNLRRADEIPQ